MGEQLSRNWGPDFLILGTQKGGTNSLYNYMIQHPQIAPALQYKEVHFFDLNFERGVDWYQAQFPLISDQEKILLGEASPYYLFHPLVPNRVAQLFPNVKLIILLRNPADRAISHYYWEVGLGTEKLTLTAAIAQETQRLQGELEKFLDDPNYYSFNHQHYTYLARGIYLEQIERWLKYFPPEQMLILPSEDFFANPEISLNQVWNFLGLSPHQLADYKRYNPGNYSPVDGVIYQQLTEYFQPYNQDLATKLNRDFPW